MKKHNFSAGPSILPAAVMEKAATAVKDLDGIGLSLIEISHRSKEFIAIMDKAQALALELTGLAGKGYQALFLQGGASTQFLMAAANLMKTKAEKTLRYTAIIGYRASTRRKPNRRWYLCVVRATRTPRRTGMKTTTITTLHWQQ